MDSTMMPPKLCPYCGYMVDHHTTATGKQHAPNPGDVTICIACAGVAEFDAQFDLIKPAPEALQLYLRHPVVARAVRTIQATPPNQRVKPQTRQ